MRVLNEFQVSPAKMAASTALAQADAKSTHPNHPALSLDGPKHRSSWSYLR